MPRNAVLNMTAENNQDLILMKGADSFLFKKSKVGCVLCHGYTGTPNEMLILGEYLAKNNISSIGPRLPGHGTRISDLIETKSEDWYNEYKNAYNKLSEFCDEIFVCGLSMGGVLTLKFAIEHKVKGIITLNTPAKFKFPEKFLLTFLAPLFPKLAVKKSRSELENQNRSGIIAYEKYPVKPANLLRKLIKDNRKKMNKISEPILIIQGLQDDKWIINSSKIIYENVSSKDKQLKLLDQSPHCLTHGSEKEEVGKLLVQFIKEKSNFGI